MRQSRTALRGEIADESWICFDSGSMSGKRRDPSRTFGSTLLAAQCASAFVEQSGEAVQHLPKAGKGGGIVERTCDARFNGGKSPEKA